MQYNMEDVVMVNTKCEKCGLDGAAPTFKQILENKESILTKMLETQGYADVLCGDCAETAVESYKERHGAKEETTD